MDWFCTRRLTLPTVGVIQPPTPTLTFLTSDECVSHVQWKLYHLKDHMERCLSCSGGRIEGPLVTDSFNQVSTLVGNDLFITSLS